MDGGLYWGCFRDCKISTFFFYSLLSFFFFSELIDGRTDFR